MSRLPYFFELSGEHPTLPRSEVLSCIRAETGGLDEVFAGDGYVICRFETGYLERICSRLALCRRAGRYLGHCTPEGIRDFCSRLELPEGSLAVRTRRHGQRTDGEGTIDISRKVADIVARGRKVDLKKPEIELRILASDRLHFYLSEVVIDRNQFEKRKVGLRPFFSPVSLHPKFARALVNLTCVRRGEVLLDPFCGTGGILLEGSLMGIKVMGSDISARMVKGCLENLEHFGARAERVEVADVGEIVERFGEVDAVATDPPYGRSTTTRNEDIEELYTRALHSIEGVLKCGGRAAIVFPRPCAFPASKLMLVGTHRQRVHRSLTRHYCIFSRR